MDPAVCCDLTETRLLSDRCDGLRNGQRRHDRRLLRRHQTLSTYAPTGNHDRQFPASSNDPGYLDLSGYAFIAGNADELVAAVKAAINIIREATYSFSQSSIQSNRTIDENFIYEGSFQPITGDPFWFGHLKKYSVNERRCRWGVRPVGRGRNVLKTTAAADRNIKTYKGGSLVDFTTASITKEDLAVATDAARDAVVGYHPRREPPTIRKTGSWETSSAPPRSRWEPPRRITMMSGTRPLRMPLPTHRANHVRSSESLFRKDHHRGRERRAVARLQDQRRLGGVELHSAESPVASETDRPCHASYDAQPSVLRRRPGHGRRRLDPRDREQRDNEIRLRLAHAAGLRGRPGRRRQSLELLHLLRFRLQPEVYVHLSSTTAVITPSI